MSEPYLAPMPGGPTLPTSGPYRRGRLERLAEEIASAGCRKGREGCMVRKRRLLRSWFLRGGITLLHL